MGCWSFLSATTDLFDLLTCDWFTVEVHRSLRHNDDVQTGAAASLLSGEKQNPRGHETDFYLQFLTYI